MDRKKAIEIVRKIYPHVGTNGSEFETALRKLVPELIENKDERIINQLISLVRNTGGIVLIPTNQEELIAYLENLQEYIDDIRQYAYNKGLVDAKRQPVEWSDDFEENIRILLHDKLTRHSNDGKTSSTVSIDDKTLKDIISGIWFYVGKEALKYPNKELNVSEWSEEDEKCIKDIIICLEYLKREDTERQWNGDRNVDPKRYEGMIAKLNSLRPQPKKEWTIKDAKPGDILHTSSTASSKTFIFKGVRNDEHGSVECYCCYDSEDGFVKGEEELIGWKTDKYRLATPEECIELGRIMGKAGYIFHFETNQLQKLDKLHWKPSKEQINALKVVVRGYPSDDLDAIESLLNDLQKLP